MSKQNKILILIATFLSPVLAFAAFPSDLSGVIAMFIGIGGKLIPFLGALAFLAFIWGIAKFIKATSQGKEIKDTKGLLIWGVVGLFVLMTVWGIISFLQSEFGFGQSGGRPVIPQIPSVIRSTN